MASRDFETIESELMKELNAHDSSILKQLFEEIKQLPDEAIDQMPEVVYARYLRLLSKAKQYSGK